MALSRSSSSWIARKSLQPTAWLSKNRLVATETVSCPRAVVTVSSFPPVVSIRNLPRSTATFYLYRNIRILHSTVESLNPIVSKFVPVRQVVIKAGLKNWRLNFCCRWMAGIGAVSGPTTESTWRWFRRSFLWWWSSSSPSLQVIFYVDLLFCSLHFVNV